VKFPAEFVQNMQDFFDDPAELAQFLLALDGERQYGMRVNTLKVSLENFTQYFHDLTPVPWCDTGFYYDEQATSPLGKNPLYSAGLYYIQEPSAMSAASLLDVQHGDRVLDLCASPGGKSTQIAAKLDGSGLLVSNDANIGRMPQLLRNIEMAGITNAIVMCETPERLAARFSEYFDKILVDAPCSGEGMFRKDPSARTAWDAGKNTRLASIQKNILHEAAKMLVEGGLMVYSTCTFSRIENEDVIDDFLTQHVDFELVKTKRIWPHIDRGEGHFVAVLRKKGEPTANCRGGYQPPARQNDDFIKFVEKHKVKLPNGIILQHKDKLYIPPANCPDISGLRVMRVGLSLGILKKNRFEPSFALAMALKKSDFAQAIDLPLTHPSVQRFLRNETFEVDAADGYNLFCVEGYPLGFGKILNKRLKNRIN